MKKIKGKVGEGHFCKGNGRLGLDLVGLGLAFLAALVSGLRGKPA